MKKQEVRLFDLLEAPRVLTSRVGRVRRGKIVKRDPSTVDTLCIHQTGVEFGAGRWALRKAGGDRQLAVAHRTLKLPYHVAAFDGFYSLTCPVDWYTHHGNSLNARTIGVGIEGRYPGLEMRRRARDTVLTESRIEAAKAALDRVLLSAQSHRMRIEYVVAHRQSNAKKPGDPGEAIWRALVEDYLVPVHGLEPLYHLESGGRRIPRQWSENALGSYL